ncbi:hypothetical protein RvY_10965 [Ramazzottius varieornatus]|uniref:Pentatricopeptide repeat-containing protein 2, mitochondrial n=1 Tax=Ramazzottius varieornatus TaxID=947166 RepID=A0A1D1VEL0_RAMVA|nr:hypothetical protein RvY_10965 [Ramazzottius varieornatus]
MAGNMNFSRALCLSKQVAQILSTGPQSIGLQASRTFAGSSCKLLYTKEAIGLSGYEHTRERTATQLGTVKDRFKKRMEQYLSADSKSLIFTEDLKNMLYLADDDNDLSMIERMMKKFVKQNEQLRFGSFVFGPVIMRMYYHLNKPDAALKAIQDPELIGMFDQMSSYNVLLDLLYVNKRYEDVCRVYESMKNRPAFAEKVAREAMVLATAACHQLGTKEAFERVTKYIKAGTDSNIPVVRKAVAFAAHLALKIKDPAQALELLSVAQNPQYVTIRNLKALALTRLDRVEDVLPLLKSVLEQENAFSGRPRSALQSSFFRDVLQDIETAVQKKGDKEIQAEFDKTKKSLEEMSAIDANTLEEFLERPIEAQRRDDQQGGRFGQSRFGQAGYGQGSSDDMGGQQQQGGFQQSGFQRGGYGGLRQPRYADDNYQNQDNRRQTSYRRPFGQDGSSSGGRSDMMEGDEEGQTDRRAQAGAGGSYGGRYGGGFNANRGRYDGGGSFGSSYGGRGGSDGYNANAEAGYRPRGGYQRNQGAQRQGLQDLDD